MQKKCTFLFLLIVSIELVCCGPVVGNLYNNEVNKDILSPVNDALQPVLDGLIGIKGQYSPNGGSFTKSDKEKNCGKKQDDDCGCKGKKGKCGHGSGGNGGDGGQGGYGNNGGYGGSGEYGSAGGGYGSAGGGGGYNSGCNSGCGSK